MPIKRIERKGLNMRKFCAHCGNAIPDLAYRSKYCSPECNQESKRPQSKQNFIDKFNETYYHRFQYVSGYTNCESRIICKCLVCGVEFETGAQYVRRGGRNIQCKTCLAYDRKIKLIYAKDERNRAKAIVSNERKIRRDNQRKSLVIQREALRKSKERYFTCVECGTRFISSREQMYCDIRCMHKAQDRKKDVRKRSRIITNGEVDWSISISKLIKRDNNTCHICNSKCDRNDFVMDNRGSFITGRKYPSVDHVIPVSKGGTHTWNNVKLAHCYCNAVKSDNVFQKEAYNQTNIVT
jgi:5-methylcytosine-specific restriction endonuclease McrA